MASGHLNPSLPVARALVDGGHEVHYLCREQMREAIEGTGAEFHDEVKQMPEMYEGRSPDMFGALNDVTREHGLEDEPLMVAMMKTKEIMGEMMLPGLLRWLKDVRAQVVVCCPLMNRDACLACEILGIPCVGIMTTAGPGSMALACKDFMAKMGLTVEECLEHRKNYQPLHDCFEHLVTTAEFLADPIPKDLAEIYEAAGTKFIFVGPLLDKAGAKRAAGHKFSGKAESHSDPVEKLREAKALGRKVIYCSMGTVITGDSPEVGWANRMKVENEEKGFTGKELCQAAWRGAFEALGSDEADAPLLLISLGPQADALDHLQLPKNAFCLPVMPQVDLLKAGVDLFLTHGGQNSFMESLSVGTPVVVCPGFADQPVNAQKAVDLGVGLQVTRPVCELEDVEEELKKYQTNVKAAVAEVFENESFKSSAQQCSQELRDAGGVDRAVDLLLSIPVDHPQTLGGA
eukprot:CAMPEP_0114664414 /NCGR_PEP_ID=MMETSP0191-20121206/28783_1 /TAXON_ID=126664 /ORGANISM="Sorites sp." /LENGTH=460 /DNA_ID=CAMNT_0001906531 /DNA_START=74 /DNA_END=1456 /DNA_ORIENTATION=+